MLCFQCKHYRPSFASRLANIHYSLPPCKSADVIIIDSYSFNLLVPPCFFWCPLWAFYFPSSVVMLYSIYLASKGRSHSTAFRPLCREHISHSERHQPYLLTQDVPDKGVCSGSSGRKGGDFLRKQEEKKIRHGIGLAVWLCLSCWSDSIEEREVLSLRVFRHIRRPFPLPLCSPTVPRWYSRRKWYYQLTSTGLYFGTVSVAWLATNKKATVRTSNHQLSLRTRCGCSKWQAKIFLNRTDSYQSLT